MITDVTRIRPNPGPQASFLACDADIVWYGGAAGGGKSYALLLQWLHYGKVPEFEAVIFRREAIMLTQPGGLWPTSQKILGGLPGFESNASEHSWRSPWGSKIRFSHLHSITDVYKWMSSQVAYFGFDELTHFTEDQFRYMLSRARSTCGVRPIIRAGMNPDADSWCRTWLDWWIDPKTGQVIPERSGVVRWFAICDDKIIWGDTREDVNEQVGDDVAMSFTFIEARLEDNPILDIGDPSYRRKLKMQNRVERDRLLNRNWNVRPAAGLYFRESDFKIIDAREMKEVSQWARAWDLAATEPSETNPDPDWTCGVKIGAYADGSGYVIVDVILERVRSMSVKQLVIDTANDDGVEVEIGIPQDPGAGGIYQADDVENELLSNTARIVHRMPTTSNLGNKITRAKSFSSQCEAKRVHLVRGAWNKPFLSMLEKFPTKGVHDDPIDASVDGHKMLIEGGMQFSAAWGQV